MIASSHRQRGVALAVSLILLVLATLIGLASVRGTTLQERMSANMYDRSLAFQRAESALRAAEAAITVNGRIVDLGGVDCSAAAGVTCTVIPDNTFTGTSANWVAVDATHDVNDDKTPGTPEYFIQFMGTGRSESNLDLGANADYAAYGNNSSQSDNVAFYRITVRSSAPGDAVDRSIVVLQATVKRAFFDLNRDGRFTGDDEVMVNNQGTVGSGAGFGDGLNEGTITGDTLHANLDSSELDRLRIQVPATGAGRMSWREIVN